MKERCIARSSAIAARQLGSEMMIMSAVDSTFFTLNEVATIIWQAADGSRSLDEIIMHQVCAEFDVEPSVALQDAENFVQELVGHGILLLSESRAVSSTPQPDVHGVAKTFYQKPAFRYERAFETMALSCGKVNPTQLQCQFNRKTS